MKRFTTAAVAAATALSLVATPAFAEEAPAKDQEQGSSQNGSSKEGENDKGGSSKDGDKRKSSEIPEGEVLNYVRENKDKATGLAKSALAKEGAEEQTKALKPLISSLKSDVAQNWEPGKTANILLGTGITAALLALIAFAAQSGMVPGLQLPF